ncbi:MAG TPA: glycosyltransferase family 39 protein [Candidatus Desulfaltia sp.]|nr:glycosyltransferase family 39 protein [Candidatus Desulfaltia sp.]
MKLLLSLIRQVRLNREFRLILVLSALAFVFKLFLLSQRSLYIDPDEGYYLLLARNLVNGNGYGFNGLPNIIFPPFLPLAIASIYIFIHNLQLSLNIITALSGTLLGVIVYLIARKKISRLASYGCFLLALFSQELNAFLPAALRYTEVLYRGSDILNCFLVLASVYCLILLVEKDRYLPATLAGLTLALAYLTRPEGFILFVGYLILLILLKSFSLIALSWKRLTCFLLIFVAFTFPYVFYLRTITGQWTLSGKISASQRYRTALLQVILKENWQAFEKTHYSLNSAATEMNDLYFGYHRESDKVQDMAAEPIDERVWSNLRLYWIIPKTLVPLQFLPFFLLGLGAGLANLIKKRSRPDLLLLSLLPYSLVIEALSYPIPRHHLFLVPVVILYGGQGALLFSSWVSRKNEVTKRKVLFLVFAVLFLLGINDQIIYSSKNLLNNPLFASARKIEFSVAQRLKEARTEVVMSSHPNIAVWASSDWQVLPRAPLPAQIEFARNKRVDYAVLTSEKKLFFHILDFKNSDLSERPGEPYDFQTVEASDYFDFIRIVKRK